MKHMTIRRDAGDMLVAALLEQAACGACVRRTGARWASATFAGMRHEITLQFTGMDAVAHGAAMAAELAEHEFALHGHIVADICVVRKQRTGDELLLDIEALTVEDI